MYKFVENLDEKEYSDFLYQQDASFMQEKAWAKVKNNWDNIICGVYEKKKLVAACSILIRKFTKKISMFYLPRGYVIDFENKDLLNFMTINIKKLAKKHHAYVVKIDPNFCVSEKFFKDSAKSLDYYSKNYDKKHQNLLDVGFKHTGFCKEIHNNLQPRYNMAIPLVDINKKQLSYEELLKTFKSKFRYYLGNYHSKRGVFFESSFDKKDIKEFVQLLSFTEKNKNIHLRNEDYFNRMIDNFQKRICLIFGKVNLETYLNFLENNNGKEEEIMEVKNLIKENGNIMTLSSALLLLPNTSKFRCSEYLYAGNNLMLEKLSVSGGVALEAAKISIEKNCQYCNLGGVDGNLKDSLSIFKSKYNAVILEFAGEYDLIINKPIYFLMTKFKPLLTKLYKIIKK